MENTITRKEVNDFMERHKDSIKVIHTCSNGYISLSALVCFYNHNPQWERLKGFVSVDTIDEILYYYARGNFSTYIGYGYKFHDSIIRNL